MATQAVSLARVRGPLVLAALTLLGACSTRTAVPTPAPVAGSPSVAPESPRPPEVASGYRTGMTTAYAEQHMAAAANPLAAEAGRRILRQGGSAIDAAIAMQAVLTLVEPQASGIGGGAFLLYWDGKRVQAYDGWETAPAGADENLFLRPDGTSMGLSEARIGGRAVGVPGVLRALELAHRRHGKLPWTRLLQPAVELAEQGFPVSPRLYTQIAADPFIAGSPEMAAYFLTPQGKPKPVGTIVRNPQLAQTLREIARHGPGAFYAGPIAADIVKRVSGGANPGTLSLADLRGYRAKERDPICADYQRWKVCGMPPPSSGGIAIAQMLGTLQALAARDPKYALAAMAPRETTRAAGLEPSVDAVHVVSEAGRQADADRGLYVADADFVPVNVKGLTDPGYLTLRAGLIGDRSTGRADPGTPPGTSIALAPDRSPPRVSTSQIVAVDNAGGAVSMTTAIDSDFGSHLMVRGLVLNSGLTDFSFVPNDGGKPVANRVQAGKRPRSSMAPTLVFERDSGRLVAALGSPGGSQSIEYVSKTLIGLLDWDMDVQSAINLPNFGSRNGPTEVERGLVTQPLVQGLKARGHDVAQIEMTSGTQAIVRRRRDDGRWGWAGGADPRREGVALGD
ncbi:gamma-glutamyltransferase family protein [Ralstonia pseudosolanacearum]|uniref:gamma-glutamyltransferase family protein n=2 Tax=Ralstonia pseudosolanacearum TaxID=1310165 RepID=UPI001FFB4194|nr:gamma-glutamyltransferase family protein [Ralstonia pseudosolanacearum]MDO3508075.1 gamma-glutamyltransferase family protein [Ralstonia pseudosolanacearum]MDO3512428.1 gamma-glutamyltransferase family protein [Ralstonia pseudosolanacearum]MDO3539371.1 gamma-glutamyltransferase family protein [Ralstonia pseudosolanacearum]MDO3612294.1 gamma-glutamyltransferase family protein [Ralstonia pseudosolanacearum]MDO3630795.1 gamma-glutamyltransferase family protein [Ralstonia pseudosolanacearum]